MAEGLYNKRLPDYSERISAERLYAMLYKLNGEVRELTLQIKALRKQTERKENE